MEHSAVLSTCIKLPHDLKTFILSIFKWPPKTVFTVLLLCPIKRSFLQRISYHSPVQVCQVYPGLHHSCSLPRLLSVLIIFPNTLTLSSFLSSSSPLTNYRILISADSRMENQDHIIHLFQYSGTLTPHHNCPEI